MANELPELSLEAHLRAAAMRAMADHEELLGPATTRQRQFLLPLLLRAAGYGYDECVRECDEEPED